MHFLPELKATAALDLVTNVVFSGAQRELGLPVGAVGERLAVNSLDFF